MVHNFLGSKKSENYADVVQEMLIAYQKLGCRISLKIHFLHSHLDFFSDNLGDVSNEHGEKFHQNIFEVETRYQGKPNDRMLSDYCWYLQGKTDASYRRKTRSQKYFQQMYGELCLSDQQINCFAVSYGDAN